MTTDGQPPPAGRDIAEKLDEIDELLRIIGQLKVERQRERDRTERLEEENARLHGIIQNWVIPALNSGKRAAEESRDLLDAIQRERAQQRDDDRAARRDGEVS